MNLTGLLNSKKTFRLLLVLNFIISLIIFYAFRNTTGGDTQTYFGLADGIRHGNYSYWYFLDQPYPDTFRNPGYPIFLAGVRSISESIIFLQLIQFLFFAGAIALILSITDLMYSKRNTLAIKNLFLIFLLPSIHVASYIPTVFPEIIVTFLLLLSIYIDLKLSSARFTKYILLGVLYGVLFQIRPVILFLPFIIAAVRYFQNRAEFSFLKNAVMLMIFVLTMIPYGLWNQKHHGVFKITSLEGGGGVFHLGYWMFKLPDYYEPRYWGNYCTRELIPFIEEKDRDRNIAAYNAEWDQIDAACNPLLTAKDSAMITIQKEHPHLFKTYTSTFTLKREALLKEFALKNIKADFPFYIKAKIYSAIRLWVTGIPLKKYHEAGKVKKIYLLYPFILTLITFLAALVFVTTAFLKYRKEMMPVFILLIISLYFGIMHIPFTIQSRYTIPVRLELLLMIAIAVYMIFIYKKEAVSNKLTA